MAGIKIHQYPLERTSIGDEDYYDIDYYTGSGYQSAKIKGSTLKNVLGANYIDISTFISGYDLTNVDAGKLITNSNANVRTLVITSGLALPNNMVSVKGRIAIQPETGVNITLPDGSIITEPTQFTCEADEVYILHKSGFTGDNYILVSVKKSENIGTNDLIISDTVRELQVATDGTFQIVTNDANNSAIFKVGENNNERFSEIEFNTVIFDLISKFQNPAITAGVIVEVNPNEFKFIVLPNTSNTSVYHGLISVDANKTIIEKSNAGKFLLDSSLSSNTFEDLRATKTGLEYLADYSANFSVRSLVDKGYVDSKPDTNLSNSNLSQTDADRTYDIGTGNRTLKFLSGANEKVNFHTDGGNPTIEAFKRNSGPALKVNKVSGAGNAFEVVGGDTLLEGRLELNSVTNGFLMNRVTTLQMNSIATPSTNELVFNTDLNGLYRYDGSSWVALSAGYGIIGVYSGTGNGTPVFFADLQSALETCKASGGYFTVKLYSNITITNDIYIDYTGSGVGFAYQFRQLTIDFNGFSITNAQANSTNAFDIRLSNLSTFYQNVTLLNGAILRTNGTGTHRAIKIDTGGRVGNLTMNNMFVYNQNDTAIRISLGNSTNVQDNRVMDFGNSTIIGDTGNVMFVDNTSKDIINFKVISNSAGAALVANSGNIRNFTCENKSSGVALNASSSIVASNFIAKSNSGNAVNITTGTLTNFTVISVTGIGINANIANCTVNNFTAITGNNFALKVLGSFDNNSNFSNGKCINNGATSCVQLQNFGSAHNIEGINNGSGIGIDIRNNQGSRSEVSLCKGTSIGGIGGYINASGAGNTAKINSCTFTSHWNNAGGHAAWIDGNSSAMITNTHFNVRNASANAINATSAVTVNSRYCTHNDVASTPINANVTIVSSGIIS